MIDKRYPSEITLLCSAGNALDIILKDPNCSLALVPCKKSACERYMEEYPFCFAHAQATEPETGEGVRDRREIKSSAVVDGKCSNPCDDKISKSHEFF